MPFTAARQTKSMSVLPQPIGLDRGRGALPQSRDAVAAQDMTLTTAPHVNDLTFPTDVAKLGRAIITLKRSFEGIARTWPSLSQEDRRDYEKANMAPQLEGDSGRHVYAFWPDRFVFSVLGMRQGSHACYESNGDRILRKVDPWHVAGGLRKRQWIDMRPAEFLGFADELDNATAQGDTPESSTHWLKPFPLLWAGEGKNRIQMYQDTQRPLLTNADACQFLPPGALRLYRSVVDDSVWMLRFIEEALSPDWATRMMRMGASPKAQVLPFPKVAVPLLLHYGVKVDRGWGLPWRIGKSAQAKESRLVRSSGWS